MPDTYEPRKGVYARQIENTNVTLTWDAELPERKILRKSNFNDIEDINKLKYVQGTWLDATSQYQSAKWLLTF